MSKLGDKIHTKIPPDRQAFDEIRIKTEPRYKQSGLSGDEWRISGKIEFMYKGEVVFETYPTTWSKMDTNMQIDVMFFIQQIRKEDRERIEKRFNNEWGKVYTDIVELFRFHGIPFSKHATADKIYNWIFDILHQLEREE